MVEHGRLIDQPMEPATRRLRYVGAGTEYQAKSPLRPFARFRATSPTSWEKDARIDLKSGVSCLRPRSYMCTRSAVGSYIGRSETVAGYLAPAISTSQDPLFRYSFNARPRCRGHHTPDRRLVTLPRIPTRPSNRIGCRRDRPSADDCRHRRSAPTNSGRGRSDSGPTFGFVFAHGGSRCLAEGRKPAENGFIQSSRRRKRTVNARCCHPGRRSSGRLGRQPCPGCGFRRTAPRYRSNCLHARSRCHTENRSHPRLRGPRGAPRLGPRRICRRRSRTRRTHWRAFRPPVR